jgi:hypothetical protein
MSRISTLILFSSICLHLPSGPFSSGFPTNMLHALLISPHAYYMPLHYFVISYTFWFLLVHFSRWDLSVAVMIRWQCWERECLTVSQRRVKLRLTQNVRRRFDSNSEGSSSRGCSPRNISPWSTRFGVLRWAPFMWDNSTLTVSKLK